ncbi:relaxase domain-containing protein [Actinomadura sp. 3N508]|uniref:relaxase domain-containing protein n=1 Tax=Actinomadura sp. 3N508 TaxID=3375153 RepID=UPI00379B0D97
MLTFQVIKVPVDDARTALATAAEPFDDDLAPRAFAAAKGDVRHEANSMWLGSKKSLRRIGLKRGGEVFADELAVALQGRDVSTGGQVLSPDEKGLVTSLDLRFSAPNSVSWVWCQADAELQVQLERAMLTAANGMLAYMTSAIGLTNGRGADEAFVAAAVLHAMAPEAVEVPPPLLHVHCLLVGFQDGRGRLLPADPEILNRDSATREYGAFARAQLAEQLRKLGFQLRARTGYGRRYFEIDGVPDGLLRTGVSARARCGGPVQEPEYAWDEYDS